MRTDRRTVTISAAVCLAVAVFGLTPSAYAAKPKAGIKLQVSPAHPTTKRPLTVKFRNDGSLKPKHGYVVVVRNACGEQASATVDGVIRKGWVNVVTLAVPSARGAWCFGKATVSIRDKGYPSTALFEKTITFTGSGSPAPAGTPVKIAVLPGSSITVNVPGHDARILPLVGELRGFIPGAFLLNSDYYPIELQKGFLSLDPFTPNAVCAGPAPPVSFPLAANPKISSLRFPRNGAVTTTLALDADPLGFAGCAGPVTGDTTLKLAGKLGIKKLAAVELTGTIDGIVIASGVTASATINLILKIDILDT